MSTDQEQSYYEIALTNRQVLSIFIVLLVCILGAFLGGVWLARGAEAKVEMAEAQSIQAGTVAAEAPLEQLGFFDRRDDAQVEAPQALEAADADPASASPPVASAPGPKARKKKARARRAQTEEPTSPAPTPVAPKPSPSAAVRQEPPAKAAPSGPKPAPDKPVSATAPDYLVVQVFSSNDRQQAQRIVDQLREGGYPAILSPVEVDGRTLHRVRVGPYTDRDEAGVVAEAVRRSFKLDTWITH